MQQFIMLVGNNGSGKTFYSDHYFPQEYIIVRPDELSGDYEEKWRKMNELIKKGLANNKTVVLDGLNLDRSTRQLYLAFTTDYPKCRKIAYDFGPGNEQNIKVLANERPYLTYKAWEITFIENKKLYEKPKLDEGFDEIIIIK